MSGVSGLGPADRADFERVLRSALGTAEIRSALSADPTGRAATRLRAWALAADAEIVAAAPGEYRAYAAARATAARRTSRTEGRPPAAGSGLPPAALLPLISAVSAAVLLFIGYGLLRAETAVRFAGSVRSAGWTLAVVAVAAAALGLSTLPRALPDRAGGPTGTPGPVSAAHAAHIEQARRRWHEALLERGVLPYLRRRLPESLDP
ncbi:hypothetical protein ACWEKM_34355 [Streptomyces sp. NPDC004752]